MAGNETERSDGDPSPVQPEETVSGSPSEVSLAGAAEVPTGNASVHGGQALEEGDSPRSRWGQVIFIGSGVGWACTTVIGLWNIPNFPSADLATLIAVTGFVALALVQLGKIATTDGARSKHVLVILGAGLVLLVIIGANRIYDGQRERDLIAAGRGDPIIPLQGGVLDLTGDAMASSSAPLRLRVDPVGLEPNEVTNYRYAQCLKVGLCGTPDDGGTIRNDGAEDLPVAGVSVEDAFKFCTWIGRRMITELDWVHAVRGTGDSPRTWPWGEEDPNPTLANLTFLEGDDPGPIVWPPPRDGDTPTDNGTPGTIEPPVTQGSPVEVDARPDGATPEGITHLVGNMAEWTSTSPELCPSRAECPFRWTPNNARARTIITRGHSFTTHVYNDGNEYASASRADEVLIEPLLREADIGFRCAEDLS